MTHPITLCTALALMLTFPAAVSHSAAPDETALNLIAPAVPPPEIPEEMMPGFRLARIAFDREFDSPVMLTTMPESDGEQVVAMQRGEFCALRMDSTTEWRPFLDFRERMKDILLFEEGVHGIAFHPQFATNRLFYLSYSQNEPRRTVISEMRATEGESPVAIPETERIVLEVQQPLADHWGGHLAFGPDGMLYIALGDGGLRDDPYRLAQNPWVLHGKILRIDVNSRTQRLPYGIPQDNPFTGEQTMRHEIYALGLRNPWGLSFDAKTGHLWCADVGQDLWEEINMIKKGANYGWPTIGFGANYVTGTEIHQSRVREGMEQPKAFWVPSIGISGLMFYTGDKFPNWKGNAFIGGMSGQWRQLVRVSLGGETVANREPLLFGQYRLRDVRQGPDGFIYLATDSQGPNQTTAIIRLEPNP